MRNFLDIIPRQIKTYVATVVVTLLGYVGLTCSKNCIQCYACLPLGAFVLGFMWSKNIKVQFQRFLSIRRKASKKIHHLKNWLMR